MHTLFKTNNKIIEALKTVYDPEIPINIYDMGLIYDIKENGNDVNIVMTLTAPNCPEAENLPQKIKETLLKVEGVDAVNIEITFEPAWTIDKMTDEAKIAMEMLY